MDTKLNLTSLRDKISNKMSDSMKKSKAKADKKLGKKEANKEKNKKDKELKDLKEKSKRDKKHKGDKKENKKAESIKATNSDPQDESETETLRREALALGASEADLEMLEGIEDGSESEQEFVDASDKLEKGFNTDLLKFMQGIGLKGEEGDVMVVDDEDVPELVDEEEENEEEEEEEEEEEKEEVEQKSEDSSEESEDSSEEEEEEEKEVKVAEADVKKLKQDKQDKSDKLESTQLVTSNNLVIAPRLDWYNIPLEPIENPEKLDRFARERLLERAQNIIDKENKTYLTEFTSNNSQKKFLSQILSDGTLNDKISALTLLVQESPLHNLKAFDTLLGYCEKKSRTASLQSINALKDLLVNGGLLPDRKLKSFENNAVSKDLSDTQLGIFYFEDYLKKAYFKLISILEVLSHDPILHVRMTVVGHLFELLKAKPEQEFNLLRLGINKLGDIDNKVCSKTSYQILQLENHHPAMKSIIIRAIIDMIFKPNVDYNSKYYSVITLNQTILLRQDTELANELVKTYFSLFEKLLSEADEASALDGAPSKTDNVLGKSEHGRNNSRKNFKKGKKGGKSVKAVEKTQYEIVEEKNTKLFSALLTGLNRAFPFCNLPSEVFEQHLTTLFKITHSKNFNTSVQALGLIHHIITKQSLNPDRYFKTLYESLLDSRLIQSSKQGIYLNLLFKSLKNDKDIPRILAFVKRILQVCSHWLNVGTVSGMLFLLMELSKEYPEVRELTGFKEVKKETKEETNEDDKEIKEDSKDFSYDPRKRDPKFANAENSSLWEINHFLKHYHPTVSIYAASLLDGTAQPKPDLGLYTLAHFLDRFVYKNSKQKPVTKGSSIMQPLGGVHTGSLLVKATNVMNSDIPANTENWLDKKIEDIRPDEKFFHQYFTSKTSKLKSKKASEEEPEDEEAAAELEDQEVWKALVNSRPDVEAPSDEDLSDFDEADFDDMSDLEDDDEEQQEEQGEEVEEEEEEEAAEEEEEEEEDAFDEDEDKMFGINEEDELEDSEIELKFVGEDDSDDEEEQEQVSKKRSKSGKEDGKKSKKAKLKSLPVFASADDYAEYLNSDDEDFS